MHRLRTRGAGGPIRAESCFERPLKTMFPATLLPDGVVRRYPARRMPVDPHEDYYALLGVRVDVGPADRSDRARGVRPPSTARVADDDRTLAIADVVRTRGVGAPGIIHVVNRALLVLFHVLLQSAAGCPVFSDIAPCANDEECEAPARCGADGFCGTSAVTDAGRRVDGGAHRTDAGDEDDDAGALPDGGTQGDAGRDAGRVDAGVAPVDAGAAPTDAGNGPQLRITVTAQDALPAGMPVAADVDARSLGDGGQLELVAVFGGAPVTFVVDPDSSLTAPPTRVWFAVPAGIAATSSATFLLTKRPDGSGASAGLDDVFTVGDAFDDGAISPTMSASIGNNGTVVEGDGGVRVDIPQPSDAALLRSIVALSRARPFEIRVKLRSIDVGTSGGDGVGFMRMLSILEGAVPTAQQSFDELVAHHVFSWYMAEGGMIFTYIEVGSIADDSRGYYFLPDDTWHQAPIADVRYSGERSDVLSISFISDPTSFYFTVTTAAGVVVASSELDPTFWSDIDVRTDGGTAGGDPPLYFYFGDPLYGAAPGFSGEQRAEYALAREKVVNEPVVTVVPE